MSLSGQTLSSCCCLIDCDIICCSAYSTLSIRYTQRYKYKICIFIYVQYTSLFNNAKKRGFSPLYDFQCYTYTLPVIPVQGVFITSPTAGLAISQSAVSTSQTFFSWTLHATILRLQGRGTNNYFSIVSFFLYLSKIFHIFDAVQLNIIQSFQLDKWGLSI